MNTYDKLYESIHELWTKLDNTYYDSELTINDTRARINIIYDLLEKFDAERDAERDDNQYYYDYEE